MTDSRDAFFAELFGRLSPPETPAAMRDPAFLEGVYERAAAAAAADLGPILAESLTPERAPEDTCWREVEERPEYAEMVDAAMPAADRAPGLLWSRIRADVAEQRQPHTRRARSRRLLLRAAAAVLLTTGLYGLIQLGANSSVDPGTPEPSSFVFQLDPGLVVDDRLVGGG